MMPNTVGVPACQPGLTRMAVCLLAATDFVYLFSQPPGGRPGLRWRTPAWRWLVSRLHRVARLLRLLKEGEH
jgi:hypothetical protein